MAMVFLCFSKEEGFKLNTNSRPEYLEADTIKAIVSASIIYIRNLYKESIVILMMESLRR